MQNKTQIKFLDVGCKIGGSFTIASKYGFTSEQGIGIDRDRACVEAFIKNGYNGIVGNATSIPFPDNTFELVIFSHVLEHMPNTQEGYKALQECLRVCSKTLFVALPYFDEDEYLKSLGFKTYYSDWSGHTNKITLKALREFLYGYNYEIKMLKKIKDSNFEEIINYTDPRNTLKYDATIHKPKPYIKFNRDIWREYHIIIKK